MRLCELPEDILGEICTYLPAVDDVLALQSAHPVLTRKIDRVFWRFPKCLCLSADRQMTPHLAIDEATRLTFRNPSWSRLQAVVRKARNLKELVLGDCGDHFSEEAIFQAIHQLQSRNSSIQLQKIVAFYQNPESFCQRGSKKAWPSKKNQDELAKLVRKSGKSLLFLLLGLNHGDEFVSISRASIHDSKLQIQYCHEPSFNSRVLIIHPLLSNFAEACGPAKHLDVRMKIPPSMANIILDHCVQCCVPSHSLSRLEQITVTFTAMKDRQNAEIKEFTNFQNARNLKSLVWFLDVSLPEDKVEKLCCPLGECPYDILVQTPDMKKTYPGQSRTVAYASPLLLRCLS